ncbi:MAG: acylphosphatase [Candidatus Kerfeldbacteria bacterium]
MQKHLNIRVIGRVQGVFFRMSAKEQCELLGLTGWARNEPDGSVMIRAEGEEAQLDKLVAWCTEGPSHAYVDDVQVTEGDVQGFETFEIRYN